MPIIIKAQKGDDNNALIKKFKKFLQFDDIVTIVRDRRYHKPPSVLKKEANKELSKRMMHDKWVARRNSAKGK